jgi:hypothetical protein
MKWLRRLFARKQDPEPSRCLVEPSPCLVPARQYVKNGAVDSFTYVRSSQPTKRMHSDSDWRREDSELPTLETMLICNGCGLWELLGDLRGVQVGDYKPCKKCGLKQWLWQNEALG